MVRGRNTSPSVRIFLAKALASRAVSLQTEHDPILSEPEEPVHIGAGTPPIPPAPRPLPHHHHRTVAASRTHDAITPLTARDVHMPPTQALAQLAAHFHGSARDRATTTGLARELLGIVEQQGLLRGHAAVGVAGACVFAAEKALHHRTTTPPLLSGRGVEAVGGSSYALRAAFLEPQAVSSGSRAVVGAVIGAGGEPMRFPGRSTRGGRVRAGSSRRESPLVGLRRRVTARGESGLRMVVSANDVDGPGG